MYLKKSRTILVIVVTVIVISVFKLSAGTFCPTHSIDIGLKTTFRNIIVMAEHRCSQYCPQSAEQHYFKLVARHRSQMVTT